MEASTLTHASRSGLLARRSPLLRLQSDDRLIGLIREHHDRAFEVLFDRYQSRLLAFCRGMLGSAEDAEDVLQEVFVNAHAAMLADRRPIKVRPWLYRIARNRCLNHLRRPVADGQDTMDVHECRGAGTLERVQRREELRAIFDDVAELPETQRTALVLREIDDLCYEEIAEAMGTTLPAVKSLLVRARMSLAEASEARVLDCGEVRLQLAEAAEGLRKLDGASRHHVRKCDGCGRYRSELRSSSRALGGLAPVLSLWALKKTIVAKLFGGSSSGGAAGSAGGTGAAAGGAGGATAAGAGTSGVAIGGGAAGGIAGGAAAGGTIAGGGLATGAIGAVGAKAATGFATAALLTAGAVGVQHYADQPASHSPAAAASAATPRVATYHGVPAHHASAAKSAPVHSRPAPAPTPPATSAAPASPAPAPATPPAGQSAVPAPADGATASPVDAQGSDLTATGQSLPPTTTPTYGDPAGDPAPSPVPTPTPPVPPGAVSPTPQPTPTGPPLPAPVPVPAPPPQPGAPIPSPPGS